MRSPPRVLSAITALLVCAASLLVLHACQNTPEVSGPAAATTTVKYTLTVSGSGTGTGVVTSVPAGINCTITAGTAASTGCSVQYNKGTTVVLTATPAAGHSFASWSGWCGGSGTCTVTMGNNRSVTARFLKGPFWIKVAGGGSGTGSGTVKTQTGLTPAINCTITNGTGGTKCGASYPAYQLLTLTATPAAGNTFVGWSPICTSAGTGPCNYTAIQGRTITATFSNSGASYLLTIAGLGSGSGTVTSQSGLSPAIACTITAGTTGSTGCSATYPNGTVVTLTATPNGGHVFTGWQGACTGTGDCNITMSQAKSVTAGFSTSGTSVEATAGQWGSLITTPVINLHLHLLTSGKVLMWGHNGEGQLWDPANPTAFTQITNPFELFCSGSAYLPDGRLLTAGGHITNDHGLPSAAIFDPATNGWSLTGSMARGRWYPTLTTLPNGEILVMAGQDENGLVVDLAEIWNGSTWRQLTGASLSLPYYPRNFVAPNGRVFMAGEVQTTRYLNTNGSGSWSTVANRNFAIRDYASAVMYAPGKIVYIGGGNTPTRTAEVIDLNQASPSWRTVTSMAFARRQLNATLLADGKVLVTHGTSATGFNNEAGGVRDAELWDPVAESWSTMAAESAIRVYHSTALLLPDARLLSTGSGDGAGSTNRFSLQIFTPPYLFNNDGSLAARPLITSAPGSLSYGQSFQVESPSASSVTKGTLIRLSSVTHADNMSQVIYPLTFSQGATTLTATAPPSANIAPPGPYMLFLINSNGVPSVAKILLIGQ